MSKGTNGKPVIREDGKVLKGEDYQPPDLSFLIEIFQNQEDNEKENRSPDQQKG